MRLDRVDLYFLHSNICEDDTVYAHGNDYRAAYATPWSRYGSRKSFRHSRDRARRHMGQVGITGVGVPSTILKALEHDVKPSVVQAVTNLLDSPGGIRRYAEAPRQRAIIAAANTHDVGVMGIRAVQAGRRFAEFDRVVNHSHPDAVDYRRAAPFRALCARSEPTPHWSRTDTPSTWTASIRSSSGSRTKPSSHNAWRPRRSGACRPTCGRRSTGWASPTREHEAEDRPRYGRKSLGARTSEDRCSGLRSPRRSPLRSGRSEDFSERRLKA